MGDAHEFLKNLALVMCVAGVTTVVFRRLRQPVIFGYMLAGLIVGPHLPIPLVADVHTVQTLSELGVILLMFSLGLEFSVRRLMDTGWTVAIIAALECTLMLGLGYLAARAFGWSTLESVFAGAACAISSTTIIVKAFAHRRPEERLRDLVFGVLIIEDLIAILLLALLTPAASGHGVSPASLGWTVLRLLAFLIGTLIVGMLLVPRLVRFVVRLGQSETTLVTCIGICFAMALLARTIGYSVALGAFLAGSLVAESGEAKVVMRLVEPIRDMFAAIFFVSVGMLIDPALVASHWAAVLVFALIVLIGKTVAVSVSAFLTGAGTRTSVQAGMSLAQIGEFSFIIAAVGLASGATSPSLYPIMVAVSAITALTTPWFIRSAGPAAASIDGALPRPLQTFVALYGSWIENMRARPESSADRRRTGLVLRGLLLDACVIAALCVGSSLAAVPLGTALASRMGWSMARGQAIVAALVLLASVPFLIGMVRTARGLAHALARRAFPDAEPGRLDLAAAPRRALVVTLQLATVFAVGAPIVALTMPFLPDFVGVALFAVILSVLAISVWRSATDLQGHVRAAAEAIVDAVGRQSRHVASSEGERTLERAYHLLPGLGEPFPVRIESSSPVVGRRLAELGLRGRTGATIIAISRGQDVVLVPDGHEVLRSGDVVALAGTRAAIDDAARLLVEGEAASPAPSADPNQVDPGRSDSNSRG